MIRLYWINDTRNKCYYNLEKNIFGPINEATEFDNIFIINNLIKTMKVMYDALLNLGTESVHYKIKISGGDYFIDNMWPTKKEAEEVKAKLNNGLNIFSVIEIVYDDKREALFI